MVGNAPRGANYAGPLLDFAPIAAYPQDYFAGQQRQRALALQNAFPNGLPKTPDGNIDINAMGDTLAKLGGADYATQLMAPLLQAKMGEEGSRAIGATAMPSASAAPAPVTNSSFAAGPANFRPPSALSSAPAGPTQKPPSPVAEISMPGDGTQQNPYRPRSMADFQEIENGSYYVSPSGQMLLRGSEGRMAPGVARQSSPDNAINQNPLPVGSTEESINGPNARPTMVAGSGSPSGAGAPAVPVGGVSGSPAPVQEPMRTAQAAPDSQAQPSAASGLAPRGLDPEAFASALTQRAAALRQQAARYAAFPNGANQAKVLQEQAQAFDDRAKQIFDFLGKGGELTTEQKNAAASGSGNPLIYEQQKKVQETDITAGDKKYEGLQHQADEANQLVQTLKLNQSLMDDPNFYSGVGEEYNLIWKRLKASMGLDPSAALPQEAFRKTVSSAILDQIRSLGGQGLGQVRVAEINVMKQAAQNQDNTPAANRLLSEIQMRLATRWTVPLAQLAQAYKQGGQIDINGQTYNIQRHGYLDAGWDKLKTDYINAHPLFAKEELVDPRRIAPPLMRTPADLTRIGWRDGTPFRTPDGRIFTHAPQTQTPQAVQ